MTATDPTSNDITGTVRIGGIANGRYRVADLFAGTTGGLQVSDRAITAPWTVTRLDTLASAVPSAR